MSKEMFIKLCEELGRDPTDDEMADRFSRVIDGMDGSENFPEGGHAGDMRAWPAKPGEVAYDIVKEEDE